jgi:hypothetical protein
MTGLTSEVHLHDDLTRWVEGGFLNAEQAARIEAVETTRAADRASTERSGQGRRGWTPLVVEALGYLGGALAILAGFVAVAQLWPDIPVEAELAFAVAGTVLLGGIGSVLRIGNDAAFGRLRATLWAMSVGCLATAVGLLSAEIWHMSGTATALASSSATAVYAALLWLAHRSPLQHLAAFLATAFTAGSLVAWLFQTTEAWGPGLAVWTVSVGWAVLSYGQVLRPPDVGSVAGAVGVLFGAGLTMQLAAGHVLALATVAALLVAGVVLRRVWLLAIGALGVVIFVPITASRYLPESFGTPLALFLIGACLLTVALWLARWSRRPAH